METWSEREREREGERNSLSDSNLGTWTFYDFPAFGKTYRLLGIALGTKSKTSFTTKCACVHACVRSYTCLFVCPSICIYICINESSNPTKMMDFYIFVHIFPLSRDGYSDICFWKSFCKH